jgi:hypothetical protein
MADEIKVVKPGYKTTEFWLGAVAAIVSLAFASGAIGEGTQADRWVGLVAAALTSMGYSISRGISKK